MPNIKIIACIINSCNCGTKTAKLRELNWLAIMVTIPSAAQIMNLVEANYARSSAAIVFGFSCDKRRKSQLCTDFLKNEKCESYLLIANFYLLNIFF